LGLDESNNFAAVEVDHERLAADLASACSDRLEPPVRPEIDIVVVDGMSIVAAVVDELPFAQKPCFVRTRGIERGSFLRTHDGDRVLTTYEVHVLLSARGQPQDDAQPVAGATVADLDEALSLRCFGGFEAREGQSSPTRAMSRFSGSCASS